MSYIIICFYPFLNYKLFTSFTDVINLNYFIAIFTFLSFDYRKFEKFKVCLILLIPLCALVFRNWLILWAIIATAYQLLELRIPIKNIAKIGVIIVGAQLFFLVEANLLQYIVAGAVKVEKTERIAYDLGLGNSNNVGTTVFYFIALLYICLFRNHKMTFIFIATVINLMMFFYTSSRTFFFSNTLIIIGAISYLFKLYKKWFKYLLGILPIILIIGLLYCSLNYWDSEIEDIDRLSTGRLYLFYMFFKDFTTRDFLIGKPIELDLPLDNSYLAILHLGGVLGFGFFCISFVCSIYKYYHLLKYYIPFLIGILAASMTESLFGTPSGAGTIFWMITLLPFKERKKIFNENSLLS